MVGLKAKPFVWITWNSHYWRSWWHTSNNYKIIDWTPVWVGWWIWLKGSRNKDKLGLFFKVPPDRRLAEKTKQKNKIKKKEGKKSKQFLAETFFAVDDRSKITDPALIWKSKSPRCFKNFLDETRPSNVDYLAYPKT